MENNWDKLDKTQTPQLATVSAHVGDPLWDAFLSYLEQTYQAKPTIEYSGCGMMPGWNVKFKKGGKGLCTLYPAAGGFTVLVVIGQKEKAEAELALPTFTAYTQNLYANTKEGMGQRWLMFEITDAAGPLYVLFNLRILLYVIAMHRHPPADEMSTKITSQA